MRNPGEMAGERHHVLPSSDIAVELTTGKGTDLMRSKKDALDSVPPTKGQAKDIFGTIVASTRETDIKDMTPSSYRVNVEAAAMKQMALNYDEVGETEMALKYYEDCLDKYVNGPFNLAYPGMCLGDVFLVVTEIAKLGGNIDNAFSKSLDYYKRLKVAIIKGSKKRSSGGAIAPELLDQLCICTGWIYELKREDLVMILFQEIQSLRKRPEFHINEDHLMQTFIRIGKLREAAILALENGVGREEFELLCDIIPKLLKENPTVPAILGLVKDFIRETEFWENDPERVNALIRIGLILRREYGLKVASGHILGENTIHSLTKADAKTDETPKNK